MFCCFFGFFFLGDAGKLKEKGNHGKSVRAVGARRGGGTSPTVPAVGQGLRGRSPAGGKPCPHRLVAIVISGTITIGVFWGGLGGMFYRFVSGFSVAASYLFLCFSLVVFQGFLLFFFLFLFEVFSPQS